MSVQHKLTTVLQMVYALMRKDHFNVNVNQALRGMEKHVVVGEVHRIVSIYIKSLMNY